MWKTNCKEKLRQHDVEVIRRVFTIAPAICIIISPVKNYGQLQEKSGATQVQLFSRRQCFIRRPILFRDKIMNDENPVRKDGAAEPKAE